VTFCQITLSTWFLLSTILYQCSICRLPASRELHPRCHTQDLPQKSLQTSVPKDPDEPHHRKSRISPCINDDSDRSQDGQIYNVMARLCMTTLTKQPTISSNQINPRQRHCQCYKHEPSTSAIQLYTSISQRTVIISQDTQRGRPNTWPKLCKARRKSAA